MVTCNYYCDIIIFSSILYCATGAGDDDVTECNGVKWNAMELNGMQRNAMELNAMQRNAMELNAMQWNAMELNAMQRNAMELNAMECNAMQWNAMDCNGLLYLFCIGCRRCCSICGILLRLCKGVCACLLLFLCICAANIQ